jgi:hypothetical protein
VCCTLVSHLSTALARLVTVRVEVPSLIYYGQEGFPPMIVSVQAFRIEKQGKGTRRSFLQNFVRAEGEKELFL